MTKSSSSFVQNHPQNPTTKNHSQDQISQSYQEFFSLAKSMENNLFILLDNFCQLPNQDRLNLVSRLKNLQIALSCFGEFFATKCSNASMVRADNTRFLCMEEEGKLVIRVLPIGKS